MVIMFLIFCSCTKSPDHADKNAISDVDDKANVELKARGKNLRIDVENTFQKMNKVKPTEQVYVLKDLCEKYISVGISFADLQIILHAAGMRSKLQAVKFYGTDIDETKGDFASEIVLNEALPRNAFYIVIRPESSNSANKKVGAVTGCNATSIYP